ncbi:hypothetical protein MML61_27445 (plasmid) [Mycobacterium marinum]|uniref:hypothetical protein n=1 Tax=Mycobacterium marinum TaxID=1781 RepID=UPI00045FE1D2|nr:hypothetical protein [Mycobacterium marinum]WCS21240.1 hypothetical protein MML61_27445 [Mycobacterium marinum]WOR07496.1 hypothetical protein QDR78_27270 [Mycobacterium marinum]CDM79518.1 hypothetical protein MMARE11_p00150 [Mycobacterium marinum E11]BBC69128.1 hypothetical protein MMRN_p0970 [Mycobacterium marinum]GJO51734.1 hypothetical protein NJB1604_39810 [Mycobacterium marinum]
MNFAEYEQWLRQLVQEGQLDGAACEDLLEQRRIFDSKRRDFETSYAGLVVGVAGGEVWVNDSVSALLEKAVHLDHQIYYEHIPQSAAKVVAIPL